MLLKPAGSSNVRDQFHVPSGIGKALILTGVVEEVLPTAKPIYPAKWSANIGAMEGQYPPIIRHSCPTCGQSGYTESRFGTAQVTAKFHHCGRIDTCPPEVAENYLALWATYAQRQKRRQR
jgi:hypothetical protein